MSNKPNYREPWRVQNKSNRFSLQDEPDHDFATFSEQELAERSAICVNACVGIEDPARLLAKVRAQRDAGLDALRDMADYQAIRSQRDDLLAACKVFEEICTSQIDPEHIAHRHVNWEKCRETARAAIKLAKG